MLKAHVDFHMPDNNFMHSLWRELNTENFLQFAVKLCFRDFAEIDLAFEFGQAFFAQMRQTGSAVMVNEIQKSAMHYHSAQVEDYGFDFRLSHFLVPLSTCGRGGTRYSGG